MKSLPLIVALVLAALILIPTAYAIHTGRIEINWAVVILRMWEGFLYGTGFVLALVLWYSLISAVPDKKEPAPNVNPAPTYERPPAPHRPGERP